MGYLDSLKEMMGLGAQTDDLSKLSNPWNSTPNYPYPAWPTDEHGTDRAISIPEAQARNNEIAHSQRIVDAHVDHQLGVRMQNQYRSLGDVLSVRDQPIPGAVEHFPAIPHSPVQSPYSGVAPTMRDVAAPEFAAADYAQKVQDSEHKENVVKYGRYADLYEVAHELSAGLKGKGIESETKLTRGRNGGL